MKWFLYFDYGTCNDGDHDNGLLMFHTREAALMWVSDLRREHSPQDLTVTLVEGTEREIPK